MDFDAVMETFVSGVAFGLFLAYIVIPIFVDWRNDHQRRHPRGR